MQYRQAAIEQVVVTAEQMRDIEGRIFAAGIPVAALMEKVAGLIVHRIQQLFPVSSYPDYRIGVLVGPGHNGGDALVVARELYFRGYEVCVYHPFFKQKELTSQHLKYVESLDIPCYQSIEKLQNCNLFVDGLFGFGLERAIAEPVTSAINQLNEWKKPIISIDLPSGLHTDSGQVLGVAIRATHTLCLGLWKLGLLQEPALEYLGKAELIDFDIPLADIKAILGDSPKIKRITTKTARSIIGTEKSCRDALAKRFPRETCRVSTLLPDRVSTLLPNDASTLLPRQLVSHKYKEGHLLLICGSRRYAGAALLTGLAARASGVGLLSIAVPESLKYLMVAQLPEALIIGCPETESGAISQLPLPENSNLNSFTAIACGPGLTTDAEPVIKEVLNSTRLLILDADALNILARMENSLLKQGAINQTRKAATIFTPHPGEFSRLFPKIHDGKQDRIKAVKEAAQQSGAIVLLKGARTAIANPQGDIWINPESTPALARGGSGDVLTGLMGGLLAQANSRRIIPEIVAAIATWWHAQAGIFAAEERTQLGVDAFTLTQYLMRVLSFLSK